MSRRIWDIPGGVHPPQNKDQSNGTAIAPAPIPPELIIPLAQHIGAPAKPVVSVGDKVLKGQVIAQAAGFVSVPKHAPSSGEIIAIESRPVQHPSQIDGPCIIIKTDGEDEWIEHQGIEDFTQTDPSELRDIIRNAGIAGMGGAGFPTAVKMSPKPDAKIRHLIINAVECEPYITADDRLMRERSKEIITGILIFAHLLKPETILMGIEDNKPEAIAAMRSAAQGTPVEVISVPTKYPSGGEKQIIQILTGQEVPKGGIPADIGIVCQNTGTTYAVYNAVVNGEPLISRITTLTGDAMNEKGNVEALIGTPVKELLAAAGTDLSQVHRLVMGGPMMGFTMHNPEIPVVKTTNCLIAATSQELPDPAPEQACIRCASCAQVCPANLLPQQLYWFAKANELEKAKSYNLMDCIECGACAYVCPSNIPLVQYYRFAKGGIRQQAQDTEKSDHARDRFEARQARLEQEAAEKEAKRKARAEKAAATQAKKAKAPPKAPTAAQGPDELTQLKAEFAKATKKWKDAEKSLKIAEANEAENLPTLQEKVATLKAKADEAQAAFQDMKAKQKAEGATAKPEDAKTAAAEDPLAELKAKSQKTFKAYQATKAKLAEAEAEGSDKAEALKAALEKAKAKSDAAKAELKEAREKEKEAIRERNKANAAEKDIKQLKIDAAVANSKVKKSEKALAKAEEEGVGEEAIAELKKTIETAKQEAEKASKELAAAEEGA